MKGLGKILLAGLSTFVLANTLSCATLNREPVSEESHTSKKESYLVEKVNGVKIPFTEDAKIFQGLDAKSYNGEIFSFTGDYFKENSSYLLSQYDSLKTDNHTSNDLYLLSPIGETADGKKVYETYTVDKDKFDEKIKEDLDFYDKLKEQGVYISKNFKPEEVNEFDELINPPFIYFRPDEKPLSARKEQSKPSKPSKPDYDTPTYIPGDSEPVGGGEYNPGGGGSVGD